MQVVFGRKRFDMKKALHSEDFSKAPELVIALGGGLPEEGVAFAFKEWKEFVAFAKKTDVAEQVALMDESRLKLRKRSREDMAAIKVRQQLVVKRIESDLQELSRRTELAWGSKALFQRATIKADPLEGRIFDPAMLYTGAGFTGNAIGVTYPGAPDLSWFPGMDNAVTSVQVVGPVGLFSGRFYRGISRVLVGAPYFQIPNLATLGFNNITSSVLLI